MAHIDIVGLGPGDPGQMTLKTLELLENEADNFLRTAVHPTVSFLELKGITYKSFDYLYEAESAFEHVYEQISDHLIKVAKTIDIVYAVPGNPLFGEETVVKLTEKAKQQGITYTIHPGVSFVDVTMNALEFDPVAGLKIIDAFNLNGLECSGNLLITQVYNRHMASEVKLELMKIFDPEKRVALLINAGIPEMEKSIEIPLYELDRVEEVNHLTSLFVPAEENTGFVGVFEIVNKLLSEEGCPWDKQQTPESLRPYLIEEAYEVIDAIDKEDSENLAEELGDVLFQIVFHAILGEKKGQFNIHEVLSGINEKMIRRHPHVFLSQEEIEAKEVEVNWEAIKRAEKGLDQVDSVHEISDGFKKVPDSFPALMQAQKIQKKAAKVGFDWQKKQDALTKLTEEIEEFTMAVSQNDTSNMEEELGDLLFSMVNVARLYQINAEFALRKATKKFVARFKEMEKLARQEEKNFQDCDFETMNRFWNASKTQKLS
ncbi:nucleoside triphosphate pyrophosphohydrolase [Eubacteriaceae bacterium ES3]|nr:nucleoside triphosphate pyrophosphohydrolase [Eubacteriaceae bacterium ES3]